MTLLKTTTLFHTNHNIIIILSVNITLKQTQTNFKFHVTGNSTESPSVNCCFSWCCSSMLVLNWVPNLLLLIGCIYIHVHVTNCCYWWKFYYTTIAYFSIMSKPQAGWPRNTGLTHSSGVQTSSAGPASHTMCTMGSLRGKAVEAWSCNIQLHLVPKLRKQRTTPPPLQCLHGMHKDRYSILILIIKANGMHCFSNLFW